MTRQPSLNGTKDSNKTVQRENSTRNCSKEFIANVSLQVSLLLYVDWKLNIFC